MTDIIRPCTPSIRPSGTPCDALRWTPPQPPIAPLTDSDPLRRKPTKGRRGIHTLAADPRFQTEIASRFGPQINSQIGIEIAHPTHPRAPATPSASGPPDRERDTPPAPCNTRLELPGTDTGSKKTRAPIVWLAPLKELDLCGILGLRRKGYYRTIGASRPQRDSRAQDAEDDNCRQDEPPR